MNLPDSFYIALCMTILLVGAVYWVWTQIQYVQRKVNVLENIVYELKTLCSRSPDVGPVTPLASANYPPAPPSVLGEDEDLLHETLSNEIHATIEEAMEEAVQSVQPMQSVQPEQTMQPMDIPTPTRTPVAEEPVFDMSQFITQVATSAEAMQEMDVMEADITEVTDVPEDLQPGGVGSGISAPSLSSSLDSMTIKELRRLAQQKGISGTNDMKKKDLIAAIRAVPIESFLE